MLHKIAEGMIALNSNTEVPEDIMNQLATAPRQVRSRVLYLSNVVFQAWKATKDDPNKKSPVTFELSGAQRRKLDALKSLSKLSTADFFSLLIEEQYAKHFPT